MEAPSLLLVLNSGYGGLRRSELVAVRVRGALLRNILWFGPKESRLLT